MRSFSQRLACAAVLAGLLSACATPPTGPLSSATVADYADNIDLAGRISVSYETEGAPETLTGKFTWAQQPGAIDGALASPLGQTLAVLKVTPTAATLTQTDKAPLTAADIDTLTRETLGWPLPVSGLRDWLQGYAAGSDGKRFAASPANNRVTTRDGWTVTFVNWQDQEGNKQADKPQPKRIDAERAASASHGPLSIRIVIDSRS